MTAPVVKLSNAILLSSIKKSAEAFRIRPDGAEYVVEFRLDGETNEEMRGPSEIFVHVIRRMAVMANLPTYRKGDGAIGPIHLLVGKLVYRFEIEVDGHGPELTLSGRLLADSESSGPYR